MILFIESREINGFWLSILNFHIVLSISAVRFIHQIKKKKACHIAELKSHTGTPYRHTHTHTQTNKSPSRTLIKINWFFFISSKFHTYFTGLVVGGSVLLLLSLICFAIVSVYHRRNDSRWYLRIDNDK